MEDKDFRQKLIRISMVFTVLVVCILGFDKIRWLLGVLIDGFYPFLIGGFLALLLNIPTRFFENRVFKFRGKIGKKLRRPLAITVSLLLVCLFIGIVCLLIIPQVVDTIGELANAIPEFLQSIVEIVEGKIELKDEALEAFNEFKEAIQSWPSLVAYVTKLISGDNSSDAIGSAYDLVGSLFGSVTTILIAVFFMLYALMEKEDIGAFFYKLCKTYLHEEKTEKLLHIVKVTHQNIEDFFFGQCLESVIVATIFTIVASIFGFKCSLVIGIAMVFLALIPYVGNFVACGIGAVLTLAMESPTRALVFIAIFMIIQMLDAYFLYPRVIGLKVNMPPLAIFVAAIVGGNLFGFVGMFLMIPVATTVYMLIKEKMMEVGVEGQDTPYMSRKLKQKMKHDKKQHQLRMADEKTKTRVQQEVEKNKNRQKQKKQESENIETKKDES